MRAPYYTRDNFWEIFKGKIIDMSTPTKEVRYSWELRTGQPNTRII